MIKSHQLNKYCIISASLRTSEHCLCRGGRWDGAEPSSTQSWKDPQCRNSSAENNKLSPYLHWCCILLLPNIFSGLSTAFYHLSCTWSQLYGLLFPPHPPHVPAGPYSSIPNNGFLQPPHLAELLIFLKVQLLSPLLFAIYLIPKPDIILCSDIQLPGYC